MILEPSDFPVGSVWKNAEAIYLIVRNYLGRVHAVVLHCYYDPAKNARELPLKYMGNEPFFLVYFIRSHNRIC
jgi:hypothetical protein